MIVLAFVWPIAAVIAAVVLGGVLRNRNRDKQQPAIPDWACPNQCPPAMTIDSDGNPVEVWSQ